MGLNRWRYVEYTDDGCALYQCLLCKNKYEGRTAPGWYEYQTKIYHPVFVFCPFCGTKWDGGLQEGGHGNDRNLGPRRLKIQEALIESWSRRAAMRPARCWVLEEFCESNTDYWFLKSEWSVVNCFNPLKVSAVSMREILQKARQEEIDFPDTDCRKKYRVRIVPTPVDARL